MRTGTTRARLVLAIALVGLIVVGRAEGGDRTAARWYERAFAQYEAVWRSYAPADQAQLQRGLRDALAAAAAPPDRAIRTHLARMQSIFGLVRRAVGQPEYGIVLNHDDGPRVAVPHLVPIEAIGQALAVEGIARLYDGDATGAAADVNVLVRLARHLREDRLLGSTLLATSLLAEADDVTQVALDRGQLGPNEAGIVLDALRGITGADPLGLLQAVERERIHSMPWYRARYAGAGGIDRLREEAASRGIDAIGRAALASMTQDALDAALDATERVLDETIAELVEDDPGRAALSLARIDRAVRRGEQGLFARAVVPEFAVIHERVRRTEEMIRRRRTLLEGIVDGRVGRTATANAAVWYRRAIARLNVIAPARREDLRAFAAEPAQPVDDTMAKTLAAAVPILEILREAATIERCAFDAGGAPPLGIGPHHAPMLDLVRLAQVDAVRCIQARDFAGAADRLLVALRIAEHLRSERRLAGTLVADAAFESTVDLLRPGLEADVFLARTQEALREHARRAAASDPFGYDAALARERDAVRAWLRSSAEAPDEATMLRIDDALGRCDADQVLFLSLCGQVVRDPGADLVAAAAGLEDVFAPERLASVAEQAERVLALARSGRYDDLAPAPTEPIAQAAHHHRSATRRARRALALFEMQDEATSLSPGRAARP